MLNETKKKRIKKIIIIVVLSIVLLYLIPIPFNKTYNAIEIKLDDPNYLEHTKVHFEGVYKINIGDDEFEGHVGVEGYDITKGEVAWKIKLNTNENGVAIDYRFDSQDMLNDTKALYLFGDIFSEPFLNKFALAVYKSVVENKNNISKSQDNMTWGDCNGYCIVPNVTTRENALKVLKELDMIGE